MQEREPLAFIQTLPVIEQTWNAESECSVSSVVYQFQFQHRLRLHTRESLCRRQGVLFNTPHIYLYGKLLPYKVLTLFSVIIWTATHSYLCFHLSDLQFWTLIWLFAVCVAAAEPFFVCYLALNLMAVEPTQSRELMSTLSASRVEFGSG